MYTNDEHEVPSSFDAQASSESKTESAMTNSGPDGNVLKEALALVASSANWARGAATPCQLVRLKRRDAAIT